MSRRLNGNNASVLARGTRLAANNTHGVSCASRDCRTFDPNVSKKHDGRWYCERHGGANNVFRSNAKDEDCTDGIPGAARRARFARFRNKGKVATTTFHIPSFLDEPEKPQAVKKMTAKKVKIAGKSAKQLRREAAMAELGLTEADIIKFQGE